VIRDSSVVIPTMAVLRKKARLMVGRAANEGWDEGKSWGGNGSGKQPVAVSSSQQ
jgi:hypothetical protein